MTASRRESPPARRSPTSSAFTPSRGSTRTAQLHDCGIVYLPGRPYFLCVITEGRDADTLAEVIREISRDVFLAVATQSGPLPGEPGMPLP